MVGGVVTSVVVVLLVCPAIYYIWKAWSLKDSGEAADPQSERTPDKRPISLLRGARAMFKRRRSRCHVTRQYRDWMRPPAQSADA
jgi:hypothetical protein